MSGFKDGHAQSDGFSMGLQCGHPNVAIGEKCELCGKIVEDPLFKVVTGPAVFVDTPKLTFTFTEMRKMEKYTDMDLANLADWAEAEDRASNDPEKKKAYAAMRQGADWLLRYRAKERQNNLENADKPMHGESRPQ